MTGDRGVYIGKGKGAENKHLQLDRNNGDRDSPEIEAVIGGNSTRKGQVEASGRGRVAKMQGFATRWVTPCNLKIPHQRRDETGITTLKKRAEGAEWHQLVRCHVDEEEGMTRGRDVIRTATVRNGDINQRDACFRHSSGLVVSPCTVGPWKLTILSE
jgi:hypothetical protein